MILADKIIQLRKKNGWSQEELAEKMNVSRQSVSKWESAQSVPDLNKILSLSQIFGVSTDYLLKDEIEEQEFIEVTDMDIANCVHKVSMEDANAFITVKQMTAKWIALAVSACVLSPVCLFILTAGAETGVLQISEEFAGGMGMITLILMITASVAVFIFSGSKTSPFEYLELETLELEYGVQGMVEEKRKQLRPTCTAYNIIGTCLCILSVIPLFAASFLTENEFFVILSLVITLILAAIAVYFFIVAGINWETTKKLLQEGEYTPEEKKYIKPLSSFASFYWLSAVAIYLFWSFSTMHWHYTWIMWPVAGVLWPAIRIVGRLLLGTKR